MVSVRTSNEECSAEDIVGSNSTSDAKKTKTHREWNNMENYLRSEFAKLTNPIMRRSIKTLGARHG